MAYRPRLTSMLVTCSLVIGVAACSLTALDGFSDGDGGPSSPDGGSSGATSGDAKSPGAEAGADATSDADANAAKADPYGDAVRADEPTSWWRFEDTPGVNFVKDEMGLHRADVLPKSGAPVTLELGLPAVVGNGVKVGNMGGFLRVGDVFDFSPKAEFAVEAWIENDHPTSEYEIVFDKRQNTASGAGDGWILFLHKPTRNLDFQLWKGGTVQGAVQQSPFGVGFHHVVATCTEKGDGRQLDFYVDGAHVAFDARITADLPNTPQELNLGYGWNGSFDEMAIYEHTLTPERVLAHYQAGKP